MPAPGDLPSLVGGIGHADRDHHRDRVVGRVPSASLQRSVVSGVERCDQVHPSLGGAGQILRAHPAPPHRQRLLDRLGGERHVGDVVEPTGMAEHPRLGERPLDPVNHLPRPLVHLRRVLAERDELLVLRAGSHAEIESTVRQDVRDRGVFRNANRVVEGKQHHRGTDPYVLRARGHGSGHHHRRSRPLTVAEVVLAIPGAGESQLLGKHGIADVVGVDVLQRICSVGMIADSVDNCVLHNQFPSSGFCIPF